jgi:hypothetical protein
MATALGFLICIQNSERLLIFDHWGCAMRWQFVNSLSPLDREHKYWYWIHVTDSCEIRSTPFDSLTDCIVDARKHGLSKEVEGGGAE